MDSAVTDYPLVALEELRRVTPQELEAARAVIDRVRALREWRDGQNLDPRTDLPAGNWEAENEHNDFMDAYRLVAAGDRATIDNLRYYTNTLTGHKLIHFLPNAGLSTLMPLPDHVRAAIAGNIHRVLPLVAEYLRLRAQLPPELLIRPVWKMGEVGVDVDDIVVNQDTVRQQFTVNALWRLGVIDHLRRRVAETGTAHVVEVGGGYGSLCYHLKRIVPELTYTIVDLPETLQFSGIYLTIAAPEWGPAVAGVEGPPRLRTGGVSLVPNFQFARALEAMPGVDLGINISSFGEMTPEQVEGYGRGFARAMRGGGLLFECNEVAKPHIKANAAEILSRHFAHNTPARLQDFHLFEGATVLHSQQPPGTMLVPPAAPVPAPVPKPRGGLNRVWGKIRARPLRELPRRIIGKARRMIGG